MDERRNGSHTPQPHSSRGRRWFWRPSRGNAFQTPPHWFSAPFGTPIPPPNQPRRHLAHHRSFPFLSRFPCLISRLLTEICQLISEAGRFSLTISLIMKPS